MRCVMGKRLSEPSEILFCATQYCGFFFSVYSMILQMMLYECAQKLHARIVLGKFIMTRNVVCHFHRLIDFIFALECIWRVSL